MESCVQLTDLPNEILMLIVSFLDTRTVLHLTCVCRRLRAVVSDPTGPQWSAIGWKSSNHSKDADGLKLALKLSKDRVKCLSLSCRGNHFHLSRLMYLIDGCSNLQCITLEGVNYTEASVSRLLRLPELYYLHLDTTLPSLGLDDTGELFDYILLAADSNLVTLSLKLRDNVSAHACVHFWAGIGHSPPSLRLSTVEPPRFMEQPFPRLPRYHTAYLTLHHQPHSEEVISSHSQFWLRFHPTGGIGLLCCPDLQLCFAGPNPEKFQIFAKYHHLALQGNVDFSKVCSKLGELDLSGNDSLLPSDLQETFAVSCPNLLQLNLQSCGSVLSDLSGLRSIATNCLRLQVLNLLDLDEVESLHELWVILASMSNLKVLYVSSELLVQPDVDIPVPKFTAISTESFADDNHFNDCVSNKLSYIASIASPEIIKLNSRRAKISLSAPAFSNLTHLYLKTDVGWALNLPTDPACYESLQEFFLFTFNYSVDKDLTCALAQSKKLCVLIMHGCEFCKGDSIAKIATSVATLSIFHIASMGFDGQDYREKSSCSTKGREFVKLLTKSLKMDGRILDLKLCSIFHDNAETVSVHFPI